MFIEPYDKKKSKLRRHALKIFRTERCRAFQQSLRGALSLSRGGALGGATLDAQLAKILYTHGAPGARSATEEVVLAIKIDQHWTKRQILGMYFDAALIEKYLDELPRLKAVVLTVNYFTIGTVLVLLIFGGIWVASGAIVGGQFWSHPWWGGIVGGVIFAVGFIAMRFSDRD